MTMHEGDPVSQGMPAASLPRGIRSRMVDNGHGLRMHLLEAGKPGARRGCVVLLHGFPELAYTWRKVMLPLAAEGFHVIAPDQRGYGWTLGWDDRYDGDLRQYHVLALVRDVIGLVQALGHTSVSAVVGHDMGSTVAAYCALARPDLFRSVALMSAPFAGPPPFPSVEGRAVPAGEDLDGALASLAPPRKHYQTYYRGREAAADMLHCPQGVHDFLRAYFHHKSADWPGNRPEPLPSSRASDLARMPTYYIMERDKGMAATAAAEMPTPQQIAACAWLPDEELAVYSRAFRHTGFQGGLQWYRAFAAVENRRELQLFAGSMLDVSSCFIAGRQDWGVYQAPGRFERMQERVCTRMQGVHLIDGAGHWVQQEAPEVVSARLLAFVTG